MNSLRKEILMSFFETNQYPTKAQKEELANEAGLSLLKVSDWFERQRKKHEISREKTVFECDQCAFQSTRKHDVAEHKYRKHGEKTIGCKLCGYKSFDIREISRHTKNKHMEKDLKCDLCEYKTALRAELNTHVRSVHEGLYYSCSECDWSSKWKSRLDKHIRIKHFGYRIKCNECDWSTTRSDRLKTHVETMETSTFVTFVIICIQLEKVFTNM